MIDPLYRAQADLLLQVLPHIAREDCFALKGGTAINLFVRQMPRLSVDIDLTYLPFDDRAIAMAGISEALRRIKARVEKAIANSKLTIIPQNEGPETKLVCQVPGAQIKVEVNTTIRGQILPTRLIDITDAAEEEFGRFVSMNVVSHAELFGGKICAALDRQHPRDLFDIHHMLTTEGLTDEIRLGFITLLISHPRPLNEMLRPNFLDQAQLFDSQFSGMAFLPFSYREFEAARERLAKEILQGWTAKDRSFLLSFKRGDPDWGLLSLEDLPRMPAVQWKLANIRKLTQQNPVKHANQLRALEGALGML
jgi:predicted nucleotidyltransferase component of viral defense system